MGSACVRAEKVVGMYLSIEYARDVEIQTNTTGTTQESLAMWLAEAAQKDAKAPAPSPRTDSRSQTPATPVVSKAICVVNSGIHDMAVVGITDAAYLLNVRFYLRALRGTGVCAHFVWLQTTAVSGNNTEHPQNTARIGQWNDLVRGLLEEREFGDLATIVDPLSKSWGHVDHVHLSSSYYLQLAKLFLDLV